MVVPQEDNKRRCHACITAGNLHCDFDKFDECNFCAASAKTHCHDNRKETMTTHWIKQENRGRTFPLTQRDPPLHFDPSRVVRRSIRPECRDDPEVVETMTPMPYKMAQTAAAPPARQRRIAVPRRHQRTENDTATIYAQAELTRQQTEQTRQQTEQMRVAFETQGPRRQSPAPRNMTNEHQYDEGARERDRQLQVALNDKQRLEEQLDRERRERMNDLTRFANDSQRQAWDSGRAQVRGRKRGAPDLFGGDIATHREKLQRIPDRPLDRIGDFGAAAQRIPDRPLDRAGDFGAAAQRIPDRPLDRAGDFGAAAQRIPDRPLDRAGDFGAAAQRDTRANHRGRNYQSTFVQTGTARVPGQRLARRIAIKTTTSRFGADGSEVIQTEEDGGHISDDN